MFAGCAVIATAVAAPVSLSPPPAVVPIVDLESLDGTTGFRFTGRVWETYGYAGGGDYSIIGNSVAIIGDINGDGLSDLAVGKHGNSYDYGGGVPGGGVIPGAYIVFGRDSVAGDGFSELVDWTDLDGSNGFSVIGVGSRYDEIRAKDGGDFNGDGIADLLVEDESESYACGFSSNVYIVFGRDGSAGNLFEPEIDLWQLTNSPGSDTQRAVRLSGPFSTSLYASAIGDVNGDDVTDLLVGHFSYGSDPCYHGYDGSKGLYVVFGRDTQSQGEFPDFIDVANLGNDDGFRILPNVDQFNTGTAGDINGDGISDIVAGSHIVFGRDTSVVGNFPSPLDLTQMTNSEGFQVINPPTTGFRSSQIPGSGDLNNDGVSDLLVSGAVLFGKDVASMGDFPAQVDLSTLDGSDGFRHNGGRAVGAGDLNGDGLTDLVTGTAVLFGRDSVVNGNFPADVDLTALVGTDGFAVQRGTESYGPFSFSGDGDVNGDGFSDVVFGDPTIRADDIQAGAAFVVFGRSTNLSTNEPDDDGGGGNRGGGGSAGFIELMASLFLLRWLRPTRTRRAPRRTRRQSRTDIQ